MKSCHITFSTNFVTEDLLYNYENLLYNYENLLYNYDNLLYNYDNLSIHFAIANDSTLTLFMSITLPFALSTKKQFLDSC